ncbi:MAG: protein kinase domain-containing protein [Pseudomarimonas sp.]
MTSPLAIDRFAALKRAFQTLCEAEPPRRAELLATLALDDADLAREAGALLSRMEPSDLVPPDPAADLEQLKFGPFRVLRLLGRGGMGEVFLATRLDGDFEQVVALKRVHRLAASPDITRRFLRERQLLARLNHPAIARLIDGGVSADGWPWLAMEYVDGVSLLDYAKQQALDTRARVRLLRGVCAAVAHAHRHLIVHRDIKPANVLVTADGQTKLLDFGIAKLLDSDEAEPTMSGDRAFTLRYAAPEQVAGEAATTATDVYALGVLLFELVAGCSPYLEASSSGNWGRAALSETPQSLAGAMPRQASADRRGRRELIELDRVSRKAMAKSPPDRYADVATLDADLQDWLARKPLRSGIGSASAQTLFVLRRFRVPLGVAAATLLALSIGLAIARQQAARAAQEARTATAHLEAVLEVLGAANPGYFAGREPSASEFLISAAKQLAASRSTRPELRWRALTEIGHGLINLGKFEDASQVLQLALAAADDDGGSSAVNRLSVLALLIEAQSDDVSRETVLSFAARIESAALAAPSASTDALDALTRAGAAMSRRGEFARAERLFAVAELRLHASAPQDSQLENFWRQRGWAALRANDGARAGGFFDQADRITASAKPPLSAMRVAEGDLLQVQAALLRGDTANARRRFEAARPVYAAEFDATHTETAVFALHEAQLLLAEKEFAVADAMAQRVQTRLQDAGADLARDRAITLVLRAHALAALRNCAAAATHLQAGRVGIERLSNRLPRELAKLAAASRTIERNCAEQ